MTAWMMALLVFLATLAVIGAVALVVRDLRASRVAAAGAAALPVRLQRIRPPVPGSDRLSIAGFDRWFVQLLRDAGFDWNATMAAVLVILWGTLCGFALYVFDERIEPAVFAAILAMVLPVIYLSVVRGRRVTKLQEQLPSAMDTLARSLRAGQTIEQGIAMLGQHSPEPLAREFRWCARQLDMGLGLPAVMRSLATRLKIYEVRIFATTLVVHRQMGGNVVAVLERLAQVVRERINYRRQLRATTAAGRMSAGLVGLVTPCVFLYFFFFRPEYVTTMLNSPLGQSMLITTIILEVVGVVWMARVLKPSY